MLMKYQFGIRSYISQFESYYSACLLYFSDNKVFIIKVWVYISAVEHCRKMKFSTYLYKQNIYLYCHGKCHGV